MRLSDVRGDRVLDVVADVIEPIASIAEDEEAAEVFQPKACPEGVTPTQYFVRRMRAGVPKLLRGHKADVVAILAAIEGVTPEEYEDGLTLAKLLTDCAELLTDEAFVGFLASRGPQTGEPASGGL